MPYLGRPYFLSCRSDLCCHPPTAKGLAVWTDPRGLLPVVCDYAQKNTQYKIKASAESGKPWNEGKPKPVALLGRNCAGCKQPFFGFPKFKIVGDKHLGVCCVCDNSDPSKQGIPAFADAREVGDLDRRQPAQMDLVCG